MRISDVARAPGIGRHQLTWLYHDQAVRVELADIEKLCCHFECDPNGLFALVPDSKGTARPVVYGRAPGPDRKGGAGS